MSLDVRRIAAQLRVLADAFETDYTPAATAGPVNLAQTAPATAGPVNLAQTAPAPRGRGRPPKGEAAPAAAVAAPAAVVAEPDPFAAPPAAAPTTTIEQVRAALTDLKNAASQDIALAVLKGAGGADNLTSLSPASYGTVVMAAKAKQAEYAKAPEPVIEADPFAVPTAPTAAPEKPLTVEDVKAAVVAATKRTGADRAAKVVMDLGGKAAKADGTGFGPSWTALPKEQYAAAIAALNALPTTK